MRRHAAALLLCLVLAGTATTAARAQQRTAEPTFTFDIPVSNVTDALAAFRSTTGWTVNVIGADLTHDRTAWPVRGKLTARDALARMLLDTGVGFVVDAPTAVTVKPLMFELAGVDVVADRTRGYRVGASRTATKTETALRDIPQAFSVVTHEAIADQRMASLGDVVRYVPGVTMGQGEGNRDQPTIRGNSGNGDLFVDGVRDDVEYLRDLYNVERVEIPKGSNAMIFGRAGGGGVINRVTKQASWTPVRQLTLQGGMHDNKRGELDLGDGLGASVAGRLLAMYENSDSYRKGYNVERWGVTPTATVSLGEHAMVRGSYERFKDHRTADRGVPSFQGVPLATDPSLFFGDPTVSYSDARVHMGNLTIEAQPVSGLQIRNTTRLADYKKIYQNVFSGAVNTAGTQVAINAYNNRIWRTNVFNQTDLTGKASTGPLSHTWLMGAELGRQSSDAFRNTGYFNGNATAVNVPVGTPSTVGTPVTFKQSATDADAHTTATVWSAYAQDQIEVTRWVIAVAGVRVDDFGLEYHNNRTAVDLERSDRMVSPRLGLVLKPMTPLSIYGSYSVSFQPSSGSQFTSLTVTTQTLEPEEFTNYEVGAKWDPSPDLSVTVAGYRLDRTNTSAPDPLDPTHTVQTGAQRSKGFELSANGRIIPAWEILLGYNYQKVEITSRTAAAAPGQQPALTPHYTASLWNRYDVNERLGLGFGVLHQAKMFAAIDNLVTLPAFTRADAGVYVRVNERIRAQANVENLFDETYYSTANSNNNITPGSPRNLLLSVTVTP